MAAPTANIFWTDIPSDAIVTLEGKPKSQFYVVTKADGSKAVAYWDGQNAREAQTHLSRRVKLDAKRAKRSK